MPRRLFTTLSVLLLLLLAGVVALWIRSYFVSDWFHTWDDFYDSGKSSYWIQQNLLIGRGGVAWSRMTQWGPAGCHRTSRERLTKEPPAFHRTSEAIEAYLGRGPRPVFNFKFHYFADRLPDKSAGWDRYEVSLPLGLFALLFAVPPALWIWRWRRIRHRMANGLCLHCGYDLRATPEKCPECGFPIPANNK